MNSTLNRRLVLAALLAIGLAGFSRAVVADDDSRGYRRYDTQGRYVGSARSPSEGRLRFYNSKGELTGTARRQRDGSWRAYSAKGQFNGTIREDKKR